MLGRAARSTPAQLLIALGLAALSVWVAKAFIEIGSLVIIAAMAWAYINRLRGENKALRDELDAAKRDAKLRRISETQIDQSSRFGQDAPLSRFIRRAPRG